MSGATGLFKEQGRVSLCKGRRLKFGSVFSCPSGFSPLLLAFNYLPLNNNTEPGVLFNSLISLEQMREEPVSHDAPPYSPFHGTDRLCSPFPSEAVIPTRKGGRGKHTQGLQIFGWSPVTCPSLGMLRSLAGGSKAAPVVGHGVSFVQSYPDCPVIPPVHLYRRR